MKLYYYISILLMASVSYVLMPRVWGIPSDTLINQEEVPQSTSSKCKFLIHRSATSNSIDEAINIGHTALIIADKLNDDSLQAFAHLNLGYIYLDSHIDIDSAIFHLKESLMHFNENINPGYISNMIIGYNKLGTAYLYSSKYSLALEYYIKALSLNKDHPSSGNIAHQYGNISITYFYMKEYEEALNFNLKALIKYKNDHDTIGIFKTELNTGNIYFHSKNYQKSLIHYNNALLYSTKDIQVTSKAGLYNNFSSAYLKLNKPHEALEFAKLSISLLPSISDMYYKSEIFLVGANAFYFNRDYNTSLNYVDKCIEISFGEFNDICKDALLIKSNILEKKLDYKEALVFYKKYDSINEILFDENTSQQMLEMQNKYNAQENKLKIQFQVDQINKLTQMENRLRWGLLITVIVVISISIFLLYRYFQINRIIETRTHREDSTLNLKKHNFLWYMIRFSIWVMLLLFNIYFVYKDGFDESQIFVFFSGVIFAFVESIIHLWYKFKYGKNIDNID